MDNKKEIMGLRIFLGSFVSEIEKLYGKSILNAIIYRIGQKPGEVISRQILKKYNRTDNTPFKVPTAAFSLLENSLSQLFDIEHLDYKKYEERYIIKIKNICPFRQVIMNSDWDCNGPLCQFTSGYFESALKILTGMNVSYSHVEKESTDDYCVVRIIFRDHLKVNEEKEEVP
jgi:predicted hydrocarbon binding protein